MRHIPVMKELGYVPEYDLEREFVKPLPGIKMKDGFRLI